MKREFRKLGLGLGIALVSSSATHAQTISKLVGAGDALSMGTVTAVFNADVNDSGEWLAEVDTDNAVTAEDNAVLLNGAELLREGTNFGIPATHSDWVYTSFVDSLDINDNGEVLILINANNAMLGITSDKLVYWRDSIGTAYILMDQGVTPNTGDPDQTGMPFWDSIAEVWQNNNNQIVVSGRSNTDGDDMQVLLTHDGAGNILSQTCFVIDAVVHSTQFPLATGTHADTVQTLGESKANLAINNLGQIMFHVDDQSFGPGGTPDYTDVDAHYYIDLNEILWEADTAPTGFVYNHLSSMECDLNDSGVWAAVLDDDNPSLADDFLVMRNGAVVAQEGQPSAHDPLFLYDSIFSGTCHISDTGTVIYGASNTAAASADEAVLCTDMAGNTIVLMHESVTMVGMDLITAVGTSSDDRAASDNGNFIIQIANVAAGEGAYLIQKNSFDEFCFGDGGDQLGCTNCPCGNNAVPGAGGGCLNSNAASPGAVLVASGTPDVSTPADTLHFIATGANTSTFGILTSGDNRLPNNAANPCFGLDSGVTSVALDGLRCVGGAVLRHGSRSSDTNGDIGVTTAGWGPPNGPLAGIGVTSGFIAGQTRHFQLIYRESATAVCMTGQNTSQGVSVTFF